MRKFIVGLISITFCLLFVPIGRISAQAQQNLQYSKGECLIEATSRRILYEERGEAQLPMASTTKIVTCITVLQLCDNLQKSVKIPKKAVGIEGSSVYLKEGDEYTIEDLLYGLMLRSGNDCAVALALTCCKSIENFAVEMNKTAEKAGALNSHFENPHGLPSENHYTTARDLAYITAFAMENPTFCEIVSTKTYASRGWKNKNKLLYNCEGAIGVKTGYTKEAGRCLVSAVKRGEMTLICVVLGCANMYERSASLYDDAFAAYRLAPLLKKGQILDNGSVQRDYAYPLLKEEEEWIEIRTIPLNAKKKQEIIGQFQIYLTKQLIFSGNLYKL